MLWHHWLLGERGDRERETGKEREIGRERSHEATDQKYWCTHLSSVVEKKTSSAISVLGISWVEKLLTYQGSLLVTNTLREGEGWRGAKKKRESQEGRQRRKREGETEGTNERRESSNHHYNLLCWLVFLSMDHQPDNNNRVRVIACTPVTWLSTMT